MKPEPIRANPAIENIREAYRKSGAGLVVKVQPPDGLLIELPDGTVWGVNAHLAGTAWT